MVDEPRQPQEETRATLWLALPIVIFVLMVWYFVGFRPAKTAESTEVSKQAVETPLGRAGTFGDSFGAVNSLVSSLALAGVALTLWLQHREQLDSRRRARKADIEMEKDRLQNSELTMLAALLNARVNARSTDLYVHLKKYESYVRTGAYANDHPDIIKLRDDLESMSALYAKELNELTKKAYNKIGLEFSMSPSELFPSEPPPSDVDRQSVT